jgi:hypothetical protein
MKNQIYFNFKSVLKQTAIEAKATYKTDKPAQRQVINEALDHIIKEINLLALKEELTEKAQVQITNWLNLYTCKLHP